MKVRGLGHVCFLPPFDKNSNASSLYGHLVDLSTRQVIGFHGELMHHHDPNHSDCMDPIAFYNIKATDCTPAQDDNLQNQASTDQPIVFVVRRETCNDMAILSTDPQDEGHSGDNQPCVTFTFEPDRVLVDEAAFEHCAKYLPRLTADHPDDMGADWTVCIGHGNLEIIPFPSS
ncbi:hypothetical protein DM01DRAFT_1132972 [Hesseltinella vesiculosa]|uniref:Uncharacterized protein n=1 Tax=Hesseltinella vesiculosa TaxID=101127 RepID=A0A1X2G9B5_9FUNG|nr:hypothetical protein DM01DRAFT_1132972 [Hesseltinella vesiculosa]